jgi:polyhydroxyalkanoate synthesis regulator protein
VTQIRRYANRKLYIERRGYITLEHVGALVRAGGDVQVTDPLGRDITAEVLAHAIGAEIARGRAYRVSDLAAAILRSLDAASSTAGNRAA